MTKLRLFALLAVTGIFCACASGGKAEPAASGSGDLDAAIQQASQEINDALPEGTKVALLNFTSGSDVFSDYVLEEISIALVQGRKLTVVDRKDIDLIRGEMNFQMSGEVSDASAQEIGVMLGAQSIVSGSLIHMGESYRFRTKVINVESAAIQTSSSINVVSDPQIQYLLSQGNRSPSQPAVAQGSTPAAAATQPQTATSTLTAYKIGDTGPAGGLIFYDKGNNNGGWRYLEAAPEDAEFRAVWSIHNTQVENTLTTIGSGRRNTQLIVEKFRQTSGEWDTAAQKADELVFNEFDDWFLPSQAELDQMYGNLKRRNLGNFNNEWYWSSSQSTGWNDQAHIQSFIDGQMRAYNKNGSFPGSTPYRVYIRPIRQVTGAETARSSADGIMGDTGTPVAAKKAKIGIFPILAGILVVGGVGYLTYLAITNSDEPVMARAMW